MQTIRADQFRGRRVRFSGYLKGAEPIRLAALFLRVDGAGYTQELGNTFKPAGTDWTKYEVILDVSADSQMIAFGFILNEEGQLWGDNFQLEIVGNDVPVTGIRGYREQQRTAFLKKSEAERACLEEMSITNAQKLPLKPINLDFEQ